MRKKFICFLMAICALIPCFFYHNINNGKAYAQDNDKIYLGGQAVGFSLSMQGAFIVGLSDVITENGIKSPAKDAGVRVGDVLVSIDGVKVKTAQDIEYVVTNDKEKILVLVRNGEELFQTVTPVKDVAGKFKLGVFVKDDLNGIGTITYFKSNRFASLGHPILDDSENILKISGGNIYNCCITGCVKGERGTPGELRGIINKNEQIGSIEKNIISGVYGNLDQSIYKENGLREIEIGEGKVGNAYICSTINNEEACLYTISIIKVDNQHENKNFVIKITDKTLISKTGGIVQGMSGSPIVQNGKLIGAVTHVFINDPTRGFGISIENMLNN